jgi:hypothetical protein
MRLQAAAPIQRIIETKQLPLSSNGVILRMQLIL